VFHKMANSNWHCNYMECVEVDGVVYETDLEVREKVVQFNMSLYQEEVCTPKEMGGLGVRNLVPFNKALLGK
jgi:hypothetical protein